MKNIMKWFKKLVMYIKENNIDYKMNNNSARNIYIRTSKDKSAGNNFGY